MTPKKAIIVVLILFFVMAIIFVFLYINKQSAGENKLNNQNIKSTGQTDLNSVIEKKNNNQELTPQEQQVMDKAVQDKINEKVKVFQNLPVGSQNANTKENIDFLLNPRKTAEQDLGVKASAALSATTSPSQININDLLNPSKK